jgi:predicted nucleic acid-binding protein
MYLLDTNIVSELRKVRAGQTNWGVASWSSGIPVEELYLSAVTIEELEIGILRVERRDPLQAIVLRVWMEGNVLPTFEGRILSVDQTVAQCSARLHVPDPRPIRDGFIAATAIVHGLTIVTRNVADFEKTGVKLYNPWND